MTNRNERRLNKKTLGRGVLDNPAMKRIERNLKRAGREALEVYRIDGETPEQHVYFDVFSMREWSTDKLTAVKVPMDWERAEQLIESGAVDQNHIAEKTLRTDARPVIVGRHARGEGSDQILDGAHTYVALALAATAAGLKGQEVPVPTYLLAPEHWRKFVIPNHIAKALNFDATLDQDDRTWTTHAGDWDAHFMD